MGSVRADLERRRLAHQADEQAHGQVRRRVAAEPRHPAADAGRRRPARPVRVQRLAAPAIPSDAASTERAGERVRLVPARLADHGAARPEGHRQPGTRHWAFFTFVQDKWQVRRTSPSTSDCAGSTTRRSRAVEGRARCRTTTRRPTRCRSRATAARPNALNVKKYFKNFGPRTGISWRLERKDGRPRRLRRQHDSVPGQPLRVRLPGEAELLGNAAERIPAGRLDGGRLPGAGVAQHSRRRHHRRRARRRCSTSTYDVIPPDAARGDAALVERRVPAPAAVRLHADIAYVGNRGLDIPTQFNENAALVVGLRATPGVRSSRPLRQIGRRTTWLPTKSLYHGLQIKVDRRFNNGFLVTNSYTLGRGWSYEHGQTEHRHPHADRHRAQLGAVRQDRLHTCVESSSTSCRSGRIAAG